MGLGDAEGVRKGQGQAVGKGALVEGLVANYGNKAVWRVDAGSRKDYENPGLQKGKALAAGRGIPGNIPGPFGKGA